MKPVLIRITTIPLSLDKLLEGQPRFMSYHFDVTVVSSDKEYLVKIGKKENVGIFHLEMTRKITPFKDLFAVIRLYFFLKRKQPAIVHTHTPKAGIIGMLAAKMAGVPNRLHTVAGLPLLEAAGNRRRLLDFVESVTYACATKIYSNSRGLKEIITNLKFCKPEKLHVIGNGSSNGIDTEIFQSTPEIASEALILRKQYNITDEDFVFIFIGRLVKDKGIEELAEAFINLQGKYPNLRLLLVGPEEPGLDPLSPACLKTIHQDPAIINTGYQNDVKPFLAMADALAFPSYREGFPNVPMQAGCFNLPSIVTDINGCNEIIKHEQNGLLIPVKDTEALQTAMEHLYLNKALYQKMASNARQMIVDRYGQQKVWRLILEEYKEQLKRHKIV